MRYFTEKESEENLRSTKAWLMRAVTEGRHPTDVVTTLRDLSRLTSKAADEQEKLNDRNGVPER